MSLARAIETGDLAELPSRRDEDWRWTDLRGLLRVLPPPSKATEDAAPAGPFAGLAQTEVLIVNGRGERRLVIAPGERRIMALRIIAAANAGAHASRLEIDIGADAQLTLLESYEGQSSDYVVETDLVFELRKGGALERVVLAQDAASAVSVSRAQVSMSPGSSLWQTVATFGAKRQRLETQVRNPGGGASVRLDGIYLLNGQRHADITTIVAHTGVGGVTDQLVKGVVDGQARGVFQGRIVVSPGADRTDARMGHHALVLSDRAEVDAKPELEIYADDVACTHGNTVGALDEEALFYAGSRGIPEREARAMLIEAFVVEAIDRIGHEGARERIRALSAEHLKGSS
ncbi:MAG TPA: Fe-S cluster assembly protein SufD [Caulobacteraceae bacterium]